MAEITSRLTGFSVFSSVSLMVEIALEFLLAIATLFKREVAESYSGFNESRKAVQAAFRDFLATSLAFVSTSLNSSCVA